MWLYTFFNEGSKQKLVRFIDILPNIMNEAEIK
jgi:hypothetical protein